jgi:hypothetical protein
MNLGVVYRPKHFKSVAKMKLDDVMAKFTHDEYYKGQEMKSHASANVLELMRLIYNLCITILYLLVTK